VRVPGKTEGQHRNRQHWRHAPPNRSEHNRPRTANNGGDHNIRCSTCRQAR
jgi:hypothetical protein